MDNNITMRTQSISTCYNAAGFSQRAHGDRTAGAVGISKAPQKMTKEESGCRQEGAVQEDVERLRHWLEKQPHLPKDIGGVELEAFVRGTKSLEISKKKLDSYCTLRGQVPQLFDFRYRDPLDPAFQEASRAMGIFFLPRPTAEGYRVLMMRIQEDFSSFDHRQKIVRTLMMVELAMVTWPTMKGIVFCYDMKNAPANLLSRLSLTLCGVGIHWFQSAAPLKMKRGLFINSPSFMSLIVNKIGKPFLSSKLYDRIIVSTEGEETLKKFIPSEILPSDYGGAEEPSECLNDYWLEALVKRRDWFLKTSRHVSDEKKRAPDAEDIFGLEGTFRALSFD